MHGCNCGRASQLFLEKTANARRVAAACDPSRVSAARVRAQVVGVKGKLAAAQSAVKRACQMDKFKVRG